MEEAMQHAMETGKENGEVATEDKDEKEIPVITEASSPMEDQNASVKDDASNDQGDSKKATETDLQSPTSPVAEEPEIPVMNGGNHHNEEENDTTNDVDNDNKSEAMSVTSPVTPSNPIAGMLQEMQSPGVEPVKNME